MAETLRMALPLLEAAQAQKHVTVNEALTRVDALTQISLVGSDTVVPPPSPAEGDIHTVGTGAGGVWAG